MEADAFESMLEGCRRFVHDGVVPREDEIERDGRVPDDLRQQAADMGLFGLSVPEDYGGLGLTMTEEVRLAFEVGWAAPAFRSSFGTNTGIGGQMIVQFGTRAQPGRGR